jgi:hypothetical protein
MSSRRKQSSQAMTFAFPEPHAYAPLDIAPGDPRVLVLAIHEVCASLRFSGSKDVADPLYALAAGIEARHGKLDWDAPVALVHLRAATVQALALVPIERRRVLGGTKGLGLMDLEAGEA